MPVLVEHIPLPTPNKSFYPEIASSSGIQQRMDALPRPSCSWLKKLVAMSQQFGSSEWRRN
jgi:hypothetical protein